MTTKPTKATTGNPTTAKVVPIKAARSAKAATTPAPAKTGTPRTRKTAPAAPAVTTFPQAILGYLQVALQGPLGPGGIAHRIKRYRVTAIDPDGYRHTTELVSGACLPTVICQVPGYQPGDEPTGETVPTIICRDHSAAWLQSHGVVRCTDPMCWPVQPSEIEGGHR